MADQATGSILVVGRSHFQASVMAGFLSESTGIACRVAERKRMNGGGAQPAPELLLLDAQDSTLATLLESLGPSSLPAVSCAVALYDVEPNHPAEEFVTWPRLRGLFYRHASERLLVRGVLAILRGEYWLPRHVLIRHLERTRSLVQTLPPSSEPLTAKELEILGLIAEGQSNGEIATSLGISKNTVKTHVYNLFRKTNAANRIQAINWEKTHGRRDVTRSGSLARKSAGSLQARSERE